MNLEKLRLSPFIRKFGTGQSVLLVILFLFLAIAAVIYISLDSKAPSAKQEPEFKIQKAAAATTSDRGGSLPQALTVFLRENCEIVEPFAWGIVQDGLLQILGSDNKGRLLMTNIKAEGANYVATPVNTALVPVAGQGLPGGCIKIKDSQGLDLSTVTSDRDFPFKSSVVQVGQCRTHFILEWRALNRTLTPAAPPNIATIDLRILVEESGLVKSNALREIGAMGFGRDSLRDVNGDGQPDYVLITSEGNADHLRIFSIASDCSANPLDFMEDDSKGEEEPSTGGILINDLGSGKGASIHIRMKEPSGTPENIRWRITDTEFRWDAIKNAFIVKSVRSWMSDK